VFKKKDDTPIISFVSTVPGLENLENVIPRPSREFSPSWWSKIPAVDPDTKSGTVRVCPAMNDYFSQGYVMPMWADTTIKYDKQEDLWSVYSGKDGHLYDWAMHTNDQALNHTSFKTLGLAADFIFKAMCPWKIITRKGWSVYQLPMFYHFDHDFSVLPGIRDADIYHNVSQQVLYFGNGEEVTIKQGEPFAQYVPFERKKIVADIRYQTPKDVKKFQTESLKYASVFANPVKGTYHKEQRERDR